MEPRRRRSRLRRLAILVPLLSLLVACSDGGGSQAAPDEQEPTTKAPRETYVAIGDSYSAGPLIPVTDVAGGCLRSNSNYPSLVAEEAGLLLDDRTCSGATTANFARPQFPDVPPQGSALNGKTTVVTVSLGGNDERVFSELTRAFGGSLPSRDSLVARLERTKQRLTAVLKSVRRLAPNAQVLAVGYPQIVEADRVCDELPLEPADYPFAEDVNRAMADVIQEAAQASGTTYVDVWKATQGHDICSDDPWVNGAVDQRDKAARFHPFAVEHEAVAKEIVSMLE